MPPTHSFLPYRKLLESSRAVDPYAMRVTRAAGEENGRGEFVLYWTQSARRLENNLALDYAIERANAAGLPVVVYESIRPDYPAANDRIHSFVLEGVARNAADAARRGLRYLFFLPPTSTQARGVVAKLSARARLVVTDEFPTFILRDQTERFAARTPVALDLVDGNGILPMRLFEKEQYSARFLRDRAHRRFGDFWAPPVHVTPGHHFDGDLDIEHLYDGVLPREAAARCRIDHSVAPVPAIGGREAGLARLEAFVREGLRGYADGRNKSLQHTSGLSPYLHFGFLGIHEIAARVLRSDAPGQDIDAFLEEAIIRRELSFNFCFHRRDHDSLTALPDWAKKALDKHRGDRRKPLYSAEELEQAATHDDVWNLAQRQLLATGTIHGYLRMLWGKKIIEWSETPESAHALMLHLHDRYAIDGRDPNTHAGVLWCFGKHDRPWAPERPIFGTIRYMSSDATRRKVRLGMIEEVVQRAEADTQC